MRAQHSNVSSSAGKLELSVGGAPLLRRGSLLALGLLVIGSGYAGYVSAAKLTDKQRTRIEEPRPADVPSDAQLEAVHAVMHITVDRERGFQRNVNAYSSGT